MKYLRILSIVILLVTFGWFLSKYKVSFGTDALTTASANDPSQWEQPQGDLSKSDDGAGKVTMTVEYKPGVSSDDEIVFEVFLNTHSVDLDAVDFGRDIVIRKDGTEHISLSSEISGQGHHQSAIVTFAKIEAPFEIIGKNIAGIEERSIIWE